MGVGEMGGAGQSEGGECIVWSECIIGKRDLFSIKRTTTTKERTVRFVLTPPLH